jgi:WD40 repeat protein
MFAAACATSRSFPAFAFAVLGALLLAIAVPPATAQGTHLWTQSRIDEFEKGTPQGVAVGSDGHLREGPTLRDLLTTPSNFVWSVTSNKDGAAFLGTGSPATVLRVGPEKDAKPFVLFETRDVSVQVVRLGPDGALYAATLPSGRVYKLNPDATTKQDEANATVVFDAAKTGGAESKTAEAKASEDASPKTSHYIWDLTFDSSGRLYIATGGPGAVYRIDTKNSGSKPELFFKSDEEHIRSMAWDGKGNLIAGSDGSGLVYRISPQGKGYVLFDAPRREVTAVAVSADGTIDAACVGDKSHNPLPPLPVQGLGSVSFTIIQPGSLQAANASTSAPEGTDIYALKEGQAPRRIWSGKDEIVYALAARHDGLLALSGNRGRIFRIQNDGSFADVGHLEAQQGLSMAVVEDSNGSAVVLGTGNTGKLYVFDARATRRYASYPDEHEYASDVLDAGALARFGRVEVEPGSANYDLLTHSGNVEQPVRGWSDWEPLKDGAVASPAGRFLQWKAVLHAGGKLGSVGVNYLPVNAAPVVDDLVVASGARYASQPASGQQQTVSIAFPSSSQAIATVSDTSSSSPLQAQKDRTAITVRWAAHDDNGDDLKFSIYLRGDGEHVWRLLKDDITDKAYSFDSALIPDGGYQVKVVASDAPSHTPGDALTGEKESERFEVDTTPPVVSTPQATQEPDGCSEPACLKEVHVTFDAEDAASPIAHAEYSLDAGKWQYIEPVGGLSDSKREHYDLHIPAEALHGKPGEHLITVRVYDRHDNVGVAKSVFGATK